MSKKKKAPTSAATLTGAVETETGQATTSTTEHTTTPTENQPFRVADLLLHGAENGVTISHLVRLTGIDNRTLRRRIEQERRAGALILSNNRDGYYLSDDPMEVQRFTRSMLHRSTEIAKTARILERVAGLD